MQLGILDIILLVWGGYYLIGTIFKPAFFWKRDRILRTRDIIGDQKTLILYTVLAIMMIAVAIFGAYR